ncbi:hypothetical protein [Pedobacter sp. UBA5917]|jgi:hypothetical protein|uniref:hypothetical protein n=1 Tax=Pedobacter sp. UBA5917 TaxID=1947061 RepID=UPI0025E41FEA|nr:hypothetical protein [Pedobacter sp. UBA5917]
MIEQVFRIKIDFLKKAFKNPIVREYRKELALSDQKTTNSGGKSIKKTYKSASYNQILSKNFNA